MDHPIVIGSAGGEYMETAVVVAWTRALGDEVSVGDTLAVLETAKAGFEVEASHNGVLKEILFEVGEEVPVGAVLGRIGDRAAAEGAGTVRPDAGAESPRTRVAAAEGAPAPAGSADVPAEGAPPAWPAVRVVATPLARRVARERGIELSGLLGTGPGGRIKLRDVEGAEAQGRGPSPGVAPPPPTPAARAPTAAPGRVEAPSRPRSDEAPIVFLHGFGADRTAWRQVTPLLPRHHRIILLDLPGHGTAPSVEVRGIEDLAFAVADELRAMGVGEAHLVGHSLGGATALSLAQHGPLTVRSLCLIAPGGLGPEIDSAFLDGFLSATRPESLEPWLARMVADARHLPPRFAQAILRQRERDGTVPAQRAIVRALFPDGTQAIRLADTLAGLTTPAKLIWGLADAVIPSRHAFAAPGHVGLHLLRNVGHVPQMEEPALVARLIDELVRSQA